MSPVAACAPMFRARAGPDRPPGGKTFAPCRAAIPAESSVDPSSTTMHSSGSTCERPKLARHCSKSPPPLYTGITTEIQGIMLGFSLRCITSWVKTMDRRQGPVVAHIILVLPVQTTEKIEPHITSRAMSTRKGGTSNRSEEHTSELQSPCNLVCRLLLEKKK